MVTRNSVSATTRWIRYLPGLCRVVTAVVVGVPLLTPAPVAGQIPDTFENLQVLPTDISRAELVSIMRGFSMALGVRCAYCHPGGSGGSLQGVDFKTDDDADKEDDEEEEEEEKEEEAEEEVEET